MTFNHFRRFAYAIHLWLGIVSGIVLFVVCLSGAIYVFREEVQRLAEPDKYDVGVPKDTSRLSIDDLIGGIEEANPEMKVVFLAIPEQANRTVRMALASDRFRGRIFVYVDPYTGNVTGQGANVVDPFFASVLYLHRFLWLPPRIGRFIVGTATLIFVVVCVSGLILWLPRTCLRSWTAFARWRVWKPGFRIRFRKGVWPLVYDLHNTVGFYLLIPALMLALTGLCWSFTWYRQGASHLLGDQIFKRIPAPETVQPVEYPAKMFSVDEIVSRQARLTPGPGELWISVPQDPETAMVIQKGSTGFFSLAVKDKTQWDRFRGTTIPVEHYGRMVDVERFADKPFGAKITASVRAVHHGNITGLSSKILFFVTCLFAAGFPATGAALWIKKLILRRRKRRNFETITHAENIRAVSRHPQSNETPTGAGQTA